MKRLLLVLPLMLLVGCNPLAKAQAAQQAITGIIAIAQGALPELPPADAAILKPWTDLALTLDNQLKTCIAGASSNSGFAVCFDAFAEGLLSPTELAQLHLLSPSAQSKAELWAMAAILAVNTALAYFGGPAQPMPTIAAQQPTHQQLDALRIDAGIPAYGY
jgi:hypothetical protein